MTASATERFRALHQGPAAFIMPNVWDGASALMMRDAGFAAIGSSSFAYGATRGLPDVSTQLGRAESIAHAAWLGEIAKLPVNGDLADGFGSAPEDCAATVEVSIAAGLAGLGSRTLQAIQPPRFTTSTPPCVALRPPPAPRAAAFCSPLAPTICSMAGRISTTPSGA